MMKLFIGITLSIASLFLLSCGQNETGDHSGHHVHTAPHGGQLVEIGKHGSGYNLELVLHEDGFLKIYVLDSCAENFLRIPASSIDIEVTDENNNSKIIVCEPIEDPITGETIGNTSVFTSTVRISDNLPLKGIIRKLDILEFSFEDVEINFSGNSIN